MPAVVIVGTQWGDEGKGKITDYYAERADIIARFQGGNNAGHTIKVGDDVFKFHLLPSGIVDVSGEFHVGDAVDLVGEDGNAIGVGITSYSSAEISRIKGVKSDKIEEILGFKTTDEAIHRDHLVVTKDTAEETK